MQFSANEKGRGMLKRVMAIISFCSLFCVSAEACERSLDTYVRYFTQDKVEAMEGGVKVLGSGTEAAYEFKAFDKLPLKLALSSTYIGIENSTPVELPAHLAGLSADMETTFPFFTLENTYLRLGISPSFYDEDWDFQTSSFRIPVRTMLIYKPSDTWTYIAGVAVYPDFENEVYPILGLIYKPNAKLTFNLVPKRPNISYSLNEKTTLFAEGGNSFGEYEVTKDNLKNVILQYKEMRLGAGLKYKLNKSVEASLSAGGAFNRTLKYRDSLGKVNLKDSGYVEFRLVARR
jgi:hypothetical protein